MAVVNPDVVLISSDDDDDDDARNCVMAAVIPEVVLLSSDDDDDGSERNLGEGLESKQEADCNESDKEEGNDVEKSNEGECLANGDERCVRSGVFNQGGNDLHALGLYECETYMRKLGMRVSGTKEECIQRIEEHERLKDGKGESIYPESSFSINCTGDACRGDVVLFKQNMYNSQRNIIERRTVAGRIIKEAYGASTLHTFSVEVLWSKQSKKLNPLSILLVKGRNLYRFGTFRQPWKSEAERSIVLEEKHQRGREARRKRKLSETEFVSGGNKGKKIRKASHGVSSQSKHLNGPYKHKYVNKNTTAHNHVLFQNMEPKTSTQLTYHSDPNCSMYSDHPLQEESLPLSYDRTLQLNHLLPCSSSGHSHHNSGQAGPNQALSQPPDHHHQDSKSPLHRSTYEKAMLHFPESSFSINCTGDAREKDIVLFEQRIINMKKRTVAGRIVEVRQCESRNKHSFRVKVLWTIPSMNKKPSTLLVKSRNLYKFGTFRQPWEDETMRSKVIEEKHERAIPKQKLKKTDRALKKKKGGKRQKVFDNQLSSSKQPTQIAKRKSAKRKNATATPVKEKTKAGSKRKSVQLPKTKGKRSKQQTFQLHPNPNKNVNPSPSSNLKPNPVLSTTSNQNPSPHLDPNQHTNPNAHQNQNPNTCQTQNPNSTGPNLNANSNPMSGPTSNPNPSPLLNRNQHPSLNTRQNPSPKTRKNPSPNTHQNPISSAHHNPISNSRHNPHPNTRHNLHPNSCWNPNPYPTNYMHAHQLQESSLSLPNQPPVWFPPNQAPFGFPGYGGQWGPTHPPGYHYMTVLMLAALCYRQQR